jgi:peptidoglycan/xylan/chitin deacetylase (PgdA/CDA1 family)
VVSGLCRITRRRNLPGGSILNFHGLCDVRKDGRFMDHSLQLPVETFRQVCAHLASHCRVIPMPELADALQTGAPLEPNFVVLNFDDGYASNFELAYPVLKEFSLPATIFLTTGFLDGTHRLWFHRMDMAYCNTRKPCIEWDFGSGRQRLPLTTPAQRQTALTRTLAFVKGLHAEAFQSEIARIETALEVAAVEERDVPAAMRPLSWDQVREMRDSGLVTFGAHTHTHPILSRCTAADQCTEITTCRDRIAAELGSAPTLFAIPNGSASDYNAETLAALAGAGFSTACTMQNARVSTDTPLLELPRYGAPESVWETEATVSGCFEAIKSWRLGLKRLVSGQ